MQDDQFPDAIMIGGPAAAGKTTIARLLARKHGLRWYSIDAHTWTHRARAVARGLHDADDPTPGSFDRAPLIQEDLDQLASETPSAGTVIEGALITPDFAPLPRSIWLMPTADEQRRRLTDRSGTATIHHGLLYGHRLITGQLAGTRATIINVDGQTVAETLAAVEAALTPVLVELPSAHSRSDRQQVIRYGNRALADQLLVGTCNGQTDLNSPDYQRAFDCECAQNECTATIQLRPEDAIRLTDLEPGAIHADNHHHIR